MATITVEQALQIALGHHHGGQFAQAEAIYRQILAQQPNHADALHLLGLLALATGHDKEAADYITKAIGVQPNQPVFLSNLAAVHRKLGQPEQALACLARALALQPDLVEAHVNLSSILIDLGRFDEAISACERALAIQPDTVDAHNNLGTALMARKRLEEAIACFRRAIELRPDYARAYYNLGNACSESGRIEEAIASFQRVLSLQPDYRAAHNNLGVAYAKLARWQEAIACYQRALALSRDDMEAHYNLGGALAKTGKWEEAIACYHRAIALDPHNAEVNYDLAAALAQLGRWQEAITAYERTLALNPDYAEVSNDLGNALARLGQFEESIACYRRAFALKPVFVEAQWNLAAALLRAGRYEEGWQAYESRLRMPLFATMRREYSQPRWQGARADGEVILIHAEQGLGDTLQFIRYVPLVAARGARVIVECQPPLKTLLESIEAIAQVFAQGELLPDFDWQCPMMSLPLIFDTRVETIPCAIPYLRADSQKAARWRERLQEGAELSTRRPLKVGLVWAGGVRPQQPDANRIDRRRSMRLSQFTPLAGVPGVVFVSLQKDAPAVQAKTPPAGMTLLDWTDELRDLADTAALIEALDLVISVDTAVAHLAGALGKPVWLLNRFDTCWRWMLEREDSPWYPTLRIFRQPKPGDWDSVIGRVGDELAALQA